LPHLKARLNPSAVLLRPKSVETRPGWRSASSSWTRRLRDSSYIQASKHTSVCIASDPLDPAGVGGFLRAVTAAAHLYQLAFEESASPAN
jgi:hypothetical protein